VLAAVLAHKGLHIPAVLALVIGSALRPNATTVRGRVILVIVTSGLGSRWRCGSSSIWCEPDLGSG
jgi:hypothetical protein